MHAIRSPRGRSLMVCALAFAAAIAALVMGTAQAAASATAAHAARAARAGSAAQVVRHAGAFDGVLGVVMGVL